MHIGDWYDSKRYRVIHKIGYDDSSTTWLVRDHSLRKYSALKIVRSCSSTSYKELELRQYLSNRKTHHPGWKCVALKVFRTFWIDGPNGHHLALVLPLYGPSIAQMSRSRVKVESSVLQKISLQATEALAYLHSEGICHGVRLLPP